MTWDANALRLGWEILVSAAALAGAAVAMWATLNFVTRREMQQIAHKIEEAVGRHGERLTALEAELSHAPKHSDLLRVESSIRETSQCIAKLEGTIDGVRALVESIHEHLLHQTNVVTRRSRTS
jgi:t-SNARE complex subunit (syntaxin)